MSTISERLSNIMAEIKACAESCSRRPEDIQLVGVSKRKSASTVLAGVNAGVEILRENYIQEAVEKIEFLDAISPQWHFIGHLQSNKAKFAVKYFDLIHTVDTLKLAREINKQAAKIDKIQEILIQVNISEEKSKSGARAENALSLARDISSFDNLSLKGLMCMPPFFDDPEAARPYFRELAAVKQIIEHENLQGVSMEHLSMGMTGDFKVAIEEGATLVRIGTALFGARE